MKKGRLIATIVCVVGLLIAIVFEILSSVLDIAGLNTAGVVIITLEIVLLVADSCLKQRKDDDEFLEDDKTAQLSASENEGNKETEENLGKTRKAGKKEKNKEKEV